jgi:hypothetical protein
MGHRCTHTYILFYVQFLRGLLLASDGQESAEIILPGVKKEYLAPAIR